MLRTLARDPYVLLSSLAVLALFLAYAIHPVSGKTPWRMVPATGNLLLLLLALLALRDGLRQPDASLWRTLGIAYGVWLAVEVGNVLAGTGPVSRSLSVMADLGYLTFYYLVFIVLHEMAVQDGWEVHTARSLSVLDHLVGVPLFMGTLTYFVLIPARFDPASYQAMLPSSLFYAVLDTAVLLLCVVQVFSLARLRYRTFALLLAFAFAGWGIIDGLNVVYVRNGVSIDWGSLADFLWFVPFVAATAANRSWRLPLDTGEPGPALHGAPPKHRPFTAVVLTLPLLLVVYHIVGYGLHRLNPACQAARDITVIFILLLIALAVPIRWAISRNEHRFRLLVEQAPEAILLVDGRVGRVIHANPNAGALLGYPQAELAGRHIESIGSPTATSGGPAEANGLWTRVQQVLDSGEVQSFEWTLVRRDGRPIPCEVRIARLPETDRQVRISIIDISERKALEEETRRLSQALTQTSDVVLLTNRKGVIEWVNDGFVRTTGFTREEAIGATPNILNSGRHDREFFKHLWKTVTSGKTYRGVIINRRKNGTIYYDERVITPMMNAEGKITGYIATGRDVTGRIRDQERLQHLASHDVLTGLPNRALFFERLRHALTTARRHRRRLAVVYMDLDDFKTINDGLGHATGDAVLKAVARSLAAVVRIEDTVARIGGDEFVALAEEITSREEAAALAERLCSLSNKPLRIGERTLRVSVTAGIAIFPNDGVTLKDLLAHADTAMYQAKRLNPGGFRFYEPEMAISPQERLSIGQLLPGAASRGELRLEYQPCFDLTSGSASCLEALLRWDSPQLGTVPPDRFIPVAEASRTIIALGDWILEEACRQAASWPLLDGRRPGVSVNVSSLQLETGGLMERLAEILEKTGLPPWNLTLELTERMLIEDSAEVLRALADFAAMGVRVCIDDFGTGYSSLSYMNKFKLDSIKIDRSFVTALDEGSSVPSVIEAIIKMSHAHGARVVAEGVETKLQLELVRHLGCDLCQGFLLSRPIPADEVVPFLTENAHGVQPWLQG